MTNTLPQSSVPPSQARSAWVTAAAIIELLMAFVCLLLAILVGLFLLSPGHLGQLPGRSSGAGMVVGEGFYVFLAGIFLTAGIGSLKRRNWARILMLVASGVWLAFGALGALFATLFVWRLTETLPGRNLGVHSFALAIMISIEVLFTVLVPLGFLIFYTRKSVKAEFRARSAAGATPPGARETKSNRLPIPLVILAIFEAFGSISVLYILAFPTVLAFGFIIHGSKAVLIGLGYSLLSGIAAWLIYKRRTAGWNIAFFKALLGGSSMAVSWLAPNVSQLFIQQMKTPQQAQMLQLFPHFFQVVLAVSTVLTAGYVAFLVYAGKYFSTPAASSVEPHTRGL